MEEATQQTKDYIAQVHIALAGLPMAMDAKDVIRDAMKRHAEGNNAQHQLREYSISLILEIFKEAETNKVDIDDLFVRALRAES